VRDIEDHLRQGGAEVRAGVGLSDFRVDLAVRRPGEAGWRAVLVDGPDWAGRESVSDRECLAHHELVGSKGWLGATMVYLPDWISSPDAVARDLLAGPPADDLPGPVSHERDDGPAAARGTAVVTARPATRPAVHTARHAAAPAASAPPRPLPNPAGIAPPRPTVLRPGAAARPTPVLADLPTPWPAPAERVPEPAPSPQSVFHAADEEWRYELGPADLDFQSRSNEERFSRQVREIVEAEGPILLSRLVRIAAHRFGLNKLHANREIELNNHVPGAYIRRSSNGERVAWPLPSAKSAMEWRGFRVPGDQRACEEIPAEELLNAMKYLVKRGRGIQREELVHRTATIFGWGRVGNKIRNRLESVITCACRDGALQATGDVIELPRTT
jgi:hypothetical protein